VIFGRGSLGHVAKSFIRSYGNVMAFKMVNLLAVFRASVNVFGVSEEFFLHSNDSKFEVSAPTNTGNRPNMPQQRHRGLRQALSYSRLRLEAVFSR